MEDLDVVRALLDAAGLNPPEDEIERLASLYGPMRRQLASIHAVELGNVDPAVVFRAGEIARAGGRQ